MAFEMVLNTPLRYNHHCVLFLFFNTEDYSEPSRTSEIKHVAKIVNGFQPLTIFAECSILDVRLGSEYASFSSHSHKLNNMNINLKNNILK